jgi:hypothetical protein
MWTWLLALACGLVLATGCKKIEEDRARSLHKERAKKAIVDYSAASTKTNDLHGRVIASFSAANRSPNLPDYRAAMRTLVVPAMQNYIGHLETMPTQTPDLERIHLGLVAAYRQALAEIELFVRDLRSPSDLEKFDRIRDALQARIVIYDNELHQHYQQYGHELRYEQDKANPKPAAAITATTAPVSVKGDSP